jgi:UDP-glucose 4-epimerase
MSDKILVTGGCGFIGANLIPKLEKLGYEINILDNLSKGNLKYIENTRSKVFIGDIRDKNIVFESLNGVSSVIHLAAYGSVVESVDDPVENFDINVNGSFTILNECRKANIKKIIFSSTGGALMGNATPPVNERSIPRPISPYGSSKLCFEAYCSSFSHSYNMDIIALRFANVIGPVSWHKKGAVTAFMKAIMNGENIVIYGNGKATRDFLYVNDLCQGITQALQASITGFQPLHLSSGKEYSINYLAKLICEASNANNCSIDYYEKRIGEVERNFADYSLAQKMIGFEPQVSLEDAIKLTWDWFCSYKTKGL